MKIHRIAQIIACICLTWTLAGCGTSPSPRLYILEPVEIARLSESSESLTVVVHEVTLPQHLARKEILSRNEHYVISAAPFDRWAEPLDNNITSVIAENISALIDSDRVIAYPWESPGNVDLNISIQIIAFGPSPGGDVVLTALWRITNVAGDTVVLQRSGFAASRAANDATATVAAMSHVLGELSREIATKLRATSKSSG